NPRKILGCNNMQKTVILYLLFLVSIQIICLTCIYHFLFRGKEYDIKIDGDVDLHDILGKRLANFNPCFLLTEKYQKNNNSYICFPKIWIAGVGKSGTSSLMYYFSKDLNIKILNYEREWCPSKNKNEQHGIKEYVKHYGDLYLRNEIFQKNNSIIYTG